MSAEPRPLPRARPERVNIADRIREQAVSRPHARAVVEPQGYDARGRRAYSHVTFRGLDEGIDRHARGLAALGVTRGMRCLLMVSPSVELFSLTFALYRIGAVPVLLDPAMGRTNVLGAIKEVEAEALIGIPRAHLARALFPKFFRAVRISVVVGPRRSLLGRTTLYDVEELGASDEPFSSAATAAEDLAAILFTSGSTGVPKGVLYTHGIFDAQVRLFARDFGVRAGEVELSAFPLFSMFSAALGVTVIIPDMDATKAAKVDGAKILEAIEDHGLSYAFGSPVFWHRIAEHCEAHNLPIRSLSRVMMAGAPAPASLLERLLRLLPEGADVYTPYGATECLPISFPSGRALLAGPARSMGKGTCVGAPIHGLECVIIRITDEPIARMSEAERLPAREIGEIVVRGEVATQGYFRRPEHDALSKIEDAGGRWHRMGDVGYLDEDGRLWFCGRKSHRVETTAGPMYTEPVESIFNQHPKVYRSALVGVGRPKVPVIVVEPKPGEFPRGADAEAMKAELLAMGRDAGLVPSIERVLFHAAFPVDARHNAKIRREDLAAWVESGARG